MYKGGSSFFRASCKLNNLYRYICYMCPHTTIYLSAYCYMCPHTPVYVPPYYYICVFILLYVSSYYNICVLILFLCVLILLSMCLCLHNMCPRTAICVSSYYYTCVLKVGLGELMEAVLSVHDGWRMRIPRCAVKKIKKLKIKPKACC